MKSTTNRIVKEENYSDNDDENYSDSKEYVKSNPKPKYIKKETESILFGTLRAIGDSDLAAPFLKEFISNRLNVKRTGSQFQVLKRDLTDIINSKRIKILYQTSIQPSAHAREKGQYEVHFIWKTPGGSKTVVRYMQCEELTETYYYPMFKKCFNMIMNNPDKLLNRMEVKEIERLYKESIEILDKVYDEKHPEYLVSNDVFTTISNAEKYLALENEYVNEWIYRRNQLFEYDFRTMIEADLDLILEKKKVIIPTVFNLTIDQYKNAENWRMLMSRKIHGKLVSKAFTIKPVSMDVFGLYNFLKSILDWLNSKMNDLKITDLNDKIQQAIKVIEDYDM